MIKASATDQETDSPENSFTEKDILDAKNLVNFLVLAWKNYSLYPEGHVAAIKAIENLKTAFEDFFLNHTSIRFIVEKNRLLYGFSVHHEVLAATRSEDLVYILYRDGVQWLEFHLGLPLDELVYFFSTLHKYKMLVEETEGDVVTGLTDGNLEYITFKAADIFWEDLPLIDFSSISTTPAATEEPPPHAESGHERGFEPYDRGEIQAKSIADPSISGALWEISPSEQKKLQEMVQEEENWDNAADVFDVLLVILHSQTDQYSFSSVLDFTLEEVVDTIQQGEFKLLLNLFQSLYQMLNRDASTELNWRRLLIERFFQDLSRPEIFNLITGKLILLNDGDTEEIKILRELLLYFPPAIILSLGSVIQQNRFPEVQKMIMQVLEYLCLKDMSPLEMLLDHPDQKMAERLLPLLVRQRGERSFTLFFKMSEHPSQKVRGEAVRILLARDPQSILKLFPLINDPSIKVRRDILAGIGRQKSSVLENLLLKHINENVDHENTDYILACYAALGRCGSNKAIPYLRRVLLAHGWNRFWGLGKPVHRQGAATTLVLLDNLQTENILLEASKSRFRLIREAASKAMTRSNESGEDTNG